MARLTLFLSEAGEMFHLLPEVSSSAVFSEVPVMFLRVRLSLIFLDFFQGFRRRIHTVPLK